MAAFPRRLERSDRRAAERRGIDPAAAQPVEDAFRTPRREGTEGGLRWVGSRGFLAAAFVSASLLAVMSTPAFAFIHVTAPAGVCAASDQVAQNATAQSALGDHVATFEAILPDPPTVGGSLTSPLRMLYCSFVAGWYVRI
jgi:hypothetical protein